MNIDTDKINRLEVIDRQDGRKYVKHNCKIEFLIQDNKNTLKIVVD